MKNLVHIVILSLSVAFAGSVYSDPSEITGVYITKMRAYEQASGRLHSLIILDNDRMLGVNPTTSDHFHNCQFWADTKTVYLAALQAIEEGHEVDITYVARGDEFLSCQIHSLSIQ